LGKVQRMTCKHSCSQVLRETLDAQKWVVSAVSRSRPIFSGPSKPTAFISLLSMFAFFSVRTSTAAFV
jgi:hypothetical protein